MLQMCRLLQMWSWILTPRSEASIQASATTIGKLGWGTAWARGEGREGQPEPRTASAAPALYTAAHARDAECVPSLTLLVLSQCDARVGT